MDTFIEGLIDLDLVDDVPYKFIKEDETVDLKIETLPTDLPYMMNLRFTFELEYKSETITHIVEKQYGRHSHYAILLDEWCSYDEEYPIEDGVTLWSYVSRYFSKCEDCNILVDIRKQNIYSCEPNCPCPRNRLFNYEIGMKDYFLLCEDCIEKLDCYVRCDGGELEYHTDYNIERLRA